MIVRAERIIYPPGLPLFCDLLFGVFSGSDCYEYSANFAVAFIASCAQKK